jgi:hypothetical protein
MAEGFNHRGRRERRGKRREIMMMMRVLSKREVLCLAPIPLCVFRVLCGVPSPENLTTEDTENTEAKEKMIMKGVLSKREVLSLGSIPLCVFGGL